MLLDAAMTPPLATDWRVALVQVAGAALVAALSGYAAVLVARARAPKVEATATVACPPVDVDALATAVVERLLAPEARFGGRLLESFVTRIEAYVGGRLRGDAQLQISAIRHGLESLSVLLDDKPTTLLAEGSMRGQLNQVWQQVATLHALAKAEEERRERRDALATARAEVEREVRAGRPSSSGSLPPPEPPPPDDFTPERTPTPGGGRYSSKRKGTP